MAKTSAVSNGGEIIIINISNGDIGMISSARAWLRHQRRVRIIASRTSDASLAGGV